MTYVLDTHPLVWLLTDDHRLGTAARAILTQQTNQFVIPAIVLAEIHHLHQRKRIGVSMATARAHIAASQNARLAALDEFVAERLPDSLNIHDAIIVATALLIRDTLREDVTVITKDSEIVASNLVKTCW